MLRTVGVAISIVAVSLAATACEDPEPSIGLQLSANGDAIVVHYKPCDPTARILQIQLSMDGVVLYEASSIGGTALQSFVLGETPEGFEEVRSLAHALPEGRVRLSLRTSEVPDEYINFDLGDLRRDELFVRYRGRMTSVEFEERSACDGGGLFR